MPSSPPDPPLRQLTGCYDRAFEALAQADLDRVGELLQQGEALLQQLRGSAVAAADHAAATGAFARLQAAVHKLTDATRDELAQVRHGRRALHGYAQPLRPAPGGSVESRG